MFHPFRDAINSINTHHDVIADKIRNLSPDEAAAVATGDPSKIKQAAAAAPGGVLAALLAMFQGLISNPAVMQIVLSLLATLFANIIPKPPTPTPTPAGS